MSGVLTVDRVLKKQYEWMFPGQWSECWSFLGEPKPVFWYMDSQNSMAVIVFQTWFSLTEV